MGLIVAEGGEERVTGHVGRADEGVHAGQGQRGGGVEADQAAVRHGRAHRRGVQGAAHLGDVVDVGGGAGHLGAGAFVEARDAGGRFFRSP